MSQFQTVAILAQAIRRLPSYAMSVPQAAMDLLPQLAGSVWAQTAFGAVMGAIAGGGSAKSTTAHITAVARGLAQGLAPCAAAKCEHQGPVLELQELLGIMGVKNIGEGLMKLREANCRGLASRLQRVSKARNMAAHPDVEILRDLTQFMSAENENTCTDLVHEKSGKDFTEKSAVDSTAQNSCTAQEKMGEDIGKKKEAEDSLEDDDEVKRLKESEGTSGKRFAPTGIGSTDEADEADTQTVEDPKLSTEPEHDASESTSGSLVADSEAEDAGIQTTAAEEAYFNTLPTDELLPQERGLRKAILSWILRSNKDGIRRGTPLHLSDAAGEQEIKRAQQDALPPKIKLYDWIERRVGGEVVLRAVANGQHEVYLSTFYMASHQKGGTTRPTCG